MLLKNKIMEINSELKKLPGVDKILNNKKIQELSFIYDSNMLKYNIRNVLSKLRENIQKGNTAPAFDEIIDNITAELKSFTQNSLKPVINATGVVVHTNLGRSPLGKDLLQESFETLKAYNNLEFDLEKGKRGHRNNHASKLLKYLTGAEDVVVVNNNAAAVMFILSTFAKGKEVIISRGELIEIGGAFRIPDIMESSGAKMVEIGTTNKTKIADYEKAVSENTALLFKTHKSNYVIKGFTTEAKLEEIVALGKKKNIPSVYDIGSGLLRKVDNEALKDEPDVKQAIATGVDIVCFSGDKLLGGPQAGIIAGKKKYIEILKNHPMMRALRVGKTTLTFLETACKYYLNDDDLFTKNILFKTLKRSISEKEKTAKALQKLLKNSNIHSEVIKNKGRYGGGTLPEYEIDSFAVKLVFDKKDNAEKLFRLLLLQEKPVLGILRQGDLLFDVLTIFDDELEELGKIIAETYSSL